MWVMIFLSLHDFIRGLNEKNSVEFITSFASEAGTFRINKIILLTPKWMILLVI